MFSRTEHVHSNTRPYFQVSAYYVVFLFSDHERVHFMQDLHNNTQQCASTRTQCATSIYELNTLILSPHASEMPCPPSHVDQQHQP